ncbi:gluconate 2-dehydrogenase subunit 3 family protein [Natrinema longum]|uniref:Gluconate 2-dehydrogenase subunit 3 family protein n=1 Tax=Natrinema longum TaxID=370324 RepID=A0A8A2U6N5_9EURY|nr:gluconate 2-dehydrogenase subunit 3 family protein [Natrinema longum]MBZ6494317.1 gluconate 2-dehydrogenase subunit 3 family protein [Natrinema longum]QSW84360.1 gluconate 2-dehydrogenase subunit 3 family protein [Natrinema longum]
MELTRRDAVAALAALGGGTLAGCAAPRGAPPDGNGTDSGADVDTELIRETMVAAAEVVYPSAVTGTRPFVERFLEGRLADPTHAAELDAVVAELDELADAWYADGVAALSVAERDRFFRELRADTAEENPDGTTAQRVRYYVVNELLVALYASPTGGELVGIENPQGHAGGIESYQRGPRS